MLCLMITRLVGAGIMLLEGILLVYTSGRYSRVNAGIRPLRCRAADNNNAVMIIYRQDAYWFIHGTRERRGLIYEVKFIRLRFGKNIARLVYYDDGYLPAHAAQHYHQLKDR